MARLRPARLLSALLLAVTTLTSAHEGADYKFEGNDAVHQILEHTVPSSNMPGGWYAPGECLGAYCIFANSLASNGRGIAAVTTITALEKLKSLDRHLGVSDTSNFPDPPPFEVRDIPGRGPVMVANTTIRRGTRLVASSPALVVHRNFLNETSEEDQDMLIAKAVALLPKDTQKLLYDQVRPELGNVKTIKDVVARRPFEGNLGLVWVGKAGYEDEKHLFNYPEAASLPHHCRPNAAFHIDSKFVHQSTAAKKILPGEEITVSYFNPLMLRAERQIMTDRWFGTGCSCSQCNGGGDLNAVSASEARLQEIKAIEAKLKDYDSKGVTTGMLTRLVQLYEDEGLKARLAEMYGLVALNYNALGYAKRAIKFANMAVQAGIIEYGDGSNDVIAMRILAKNTEAHYSHRMRIKKKDA